mmetsp:Transcript_2839/g.6562  ORF Transcript_2839/g.6562 Transcript_2839/m.6562 type:complete len:518 (+) Transcript_2839:93-1646(+)|eukprot:CAMPEP_0173250596 /NCGR_PEP_ID=MMETSP1142-20121109/19670_1 /TAXON_ID=483371 /ORGANISM="non described non described, Strain CCMP2298" /LENGTH=517 /DNA_ID=CAMNT_0014183367 /DNA_START=67 /DNA_END=1620 /DNA_ORIENTATION=-
MKGEMSPRYRLLSITLACFQNMTLGGLLFGWASISGGLLISPTKMGGPGLSSDYVHMMFVVASFFNFLGPLLLGIVLDLYGPRICSVISILFILAGCLLFGLSTPDLPLFIPAMCLIAFGGPGTQNAIIHLSNLYPDWKATATAFITGSFQLSFVVFLIFDQLWVCMDWNYSHLFIGYGVVCAVNLVVSLCMWPDQPYSWQEQTEVAERAYMDTHEQHPSPARPPQKLGPIRLPSVFQHKRKPSVQSYSLVHGEDSDRYRYTDSADANAVEDVAVEGSVLLHDASLSEQMRSPEFIHLTLFFLVNSFWANFYIGTFDMQLGDEQMLTPLQQRDFARIFTLVITLGVLVIPPVGLLMDVGGFPLTATLTVFCGVAWSILLLLDSPSDHLLIASFAAYSLYRTSFYTFFFAYLADVLGFRYFGMLAGIIFLLGGILGMAQYPLAQYGRGTCHLEGADESCSHGKWGTVNRWMLVMVAGSFYFGYQDHLRRQRIKQAAGVGAGESVELGKRKVGSYGAIA